MQTFLRYTHAGQAAIEMLLAINERGSKIARNSVFDCHLTQIGRQRAIENSVSNDFDLRSSIVFSFKVFDCHLPGVVQVLFL